MKPERYPPLALVTTVIPYDQYTYTILSHPVYPQLAGQEMVISLPRSPRTMQISRQFYNDSIVGDGVRIDSSVFSHVIGNPKSSLRARSATCRPEPSRSTRPTGSGCMSTSRIPPGSRTGLSR